MAQIDIPKGNNEDIFDFGFDKSLNRGLDTESNTAVYDQFSDRVSAQNISLGGLVAGAANTMVALDPTKGLWLGNEKFESAPFRVNMQGDMAATSGVFSGTLTASGGSIGGFTIDTDNIRDAADSMGMASTVTGGDDVRFWAGDTFANRATADFRVTEAGAVTGSSVTITGGAISATPISAIPNSTATDLSLLTLTHNITFSSSDLDTVAWSSGTITFSNGRTFAIDAGNTGNMSARTYIYLDTGTSSTVLQTTTTPTTAHGANKVTLAVAVNSTDKAEFLTYHGTGTRNILVDNIATNSSSTNEFVANTAQIKNAIVTNAKIVDLAVSKLTAGTITSQSINLAVTDTAGDVEIRSGIAAGDFANSGAASGFIMGVDDSDSNLAKFYFGSPTGHVKFDGSSFSVVGSSRSSKSYSAAEAITSGKAVALLSTTANTHCADLESGSSQYFSIADASQTGLDITGNLTMEAWVKPESQPASGESYAIISKFDSDNGANSGRSYMLRYYNNAGTFQLQFISSTDGTSGNTTTGAVNQTLSNATWYHVAVVYTTAGSATFYVNGASIGTASSLGASIHNSTAAFYIGAYADTNGGGSNVQHWDGLIDDVRVWNTNRTAGQIASFRKVELAGTETNLQGYWQLDNNANDSTANANNLTANNAPTYSTSVNFAGAANGIALSDALGTGGSNSYIGIAEETVAMGASCLVTIAGENTSVSGLTPGTQYYISDTPGGLSTTAGTTTRKAGIATSATSLLITNIW